MSHTLLHALLEGALIQLEREPLMTLITWGFLLFFTGALVLAIAHILMESAKFLGRVLRRSLRA